jgi:hypothetical protein
MREASATIPETTGACNRAGEIFMIIVAAAIIHRNQHILLTKRPTNVHPPFGKSLSAKSNRVNSLFARWFITPNEHRTDELDELSGINNLGALAVFRKILGIARNQKVSSTGFCAFIKTVISFIRRFFDPAFGLDQPARAADDRQRGFNLGWVQFQAGTAKYL